ncbi:MAG TPA: acyl-CoA dehydrogenase family protein [Acidimicrobiia bacterium]|nr:acyl-CoA dehydrogenase family protein [Acidimicrobiia bacterium]
MTTTTTDLATFTEEARAWLSDHAPPREVREPSRWGEGSDSMALFHNLSAEEERAHLAAARHWQRQKSDAGYGSITWPAEYGGAGLPAAYEAAFRREEARFETPKGHEAISITLELIAPTILAVGTTEQKDRYLEAMRRTDEMWCQLFSEPGAGSDLASLSCRAIADAGRWILNGQKVWTSGAQYADHGYILCRTDPAAPKHRGITAFLIPMDTPGIEVRPLRQMSGGASFNEVFLTDAVVPDTARLGDVNEGWRVALTTLGFERAARSGGTGGADMFGRLLDLARHLGRTDDPLVRQRLASVYVHGRLRSLNRRRAGARLRAGGIPGPEGSISKLMLTQGLQEVADTAALLLGPRLGADSGEWGTYAWSEFVNGVPGFRIAGGSDEIQRNIIAERALGLPREPDGR